MAKNLNDRARELYDAAEYAGNFFAWMMVEHGVDVHCDASGTALDFTSYVTWGAHLRVRGAKIAAVLRARGLL